MIGRLHGTLIRKSVEGILVDVNGVGFEVLCPLTTLDRLPREGELCTLAIHTHIREDQCLLLGFQDEDERAIYRQLTAVSGVGPKLALACLSSCSADELACAIVSGDLKRLSKIPGVGKRTAERLVVELKDRLQKRGVKTQTLFDVPDTLSDLESALKNLGYSAKDVESLIEQLRPKANLSFEALLREALSLLKKS